MRTETRHITSAAGARVPYTVRIDATGKVRRATFAPVRVTTTCAGCPICNDQRRKGAR